MSRHLRVPRRSWLVLILVALLLLDMISIILLYAYRQKIVVPSVARDALCIGRAYLLRFPRDLGPWKALVVAYNTSSKEYYPLVLLPWPLRSISAWGSSPGAWAANSIIVASPTIYIGLELEPPTMHTIYTWQRTSTWLAILPCTRSGYNASELGHIKILARSKQVDGLVFEAIIPDAFWSSNIIPLPLTSDRLHVAVFAGLKGYIGSITLPGSSTLVKELENRVRGTIGLELVNNDSRYHVFFWAVVARDFSPYMSWGIWLGTSFSPYSTELRYSEDVAAPLTGAYLYALPRIWINFSIHGGKGHLINSSSYRGFFHEIKLSNTTGHVDIVGMASPRPRPELMDIDLSLRTKILKGLPVAVLSSSAYTGLFEPKKTMCNSLAARDQVVLANPIPIREPGITIPMYLVVRNSFSIEPGDQLRIETKINTNSMVEVLVNGLLVCKGLGGCNASLGYPWLFPVMLQSIISGEPLEVTILSNSSAALEMLRISYESPEYSSGRAPARLVVLEPINPHTLVPLGLIILSKTKAIVPKGSREHELSIIMEAPGLLELEQKDMDVTNVTYEILGPQTPRPTGLELAEKLLQTQINAIDHWEPFLTALKYSLENPFIAKKRDKIYITVHNNYAWVKISYKVVGKTPAILAKYKAPHVSSSSLITIPLGK